MRYCPIELNPDLIFHYKFIGIDGRFRAINNFKKIRQENNLKSVELSRAMLINNSVFSNIENGNTLPSPEKTALYHTALEKLLSLKSISEPTLKFKPTDAEIEARIFDGIEEEEVNNG